MFLSRDHLCIVLEYASAGELFESVREAGRFDEDMARFFFQQLIAGGLPPLLTHSGIAESLHGFCRASWVLHIVKHNITPIQAVRMC